jgi:uncharacterized protein YoxC
VTEPIFWLVCSFFLVAVCLTAVLVVAIPAFQELARAARSAEKLFDALHRDLPPTLDALRRTGSDINDLTDDLNTGVEHASSVVKQVDQGLRGAKHQAQEINITTRSVVAGITAAWTAFFTPPQKRAMPNPVTASEPEARSHERSPQKPLHPSTPVDYEMQWNTEAETFLEQPLSTPLDKVNSPPEQD